MTNKKDTATDVRKEFGDLPLETKIATLTQLELDTAKEAFNTIADQTIAFGNKLFNSIFSDCEPAAEPKTEATAE
jgi:hypothetical protein